MALIDRKCTILTCTCPMFPLEHIHTLEEGPEGPIGLPRGFSKYWSSSRAPPAKPQTRFVSNCTCEAGLARSGGSHVHVTTRGPEGPKGPPYGFTHTDSEGLRLITVIRDCGCSWGAGKLHDHAVREGPVGPQGYP